MKTYEESFLIGNEPQKILANAGRAGGCTRFSGREFNSERCAPSVALPDKKNSLAKLTPL
jgi:hypothetical protein